MQVEVEAIVLVMMCVADWNGIHYDGVKIIVPTFIVDDFWLFALRFEQVLAEVEYFCGYGCYG